MDKWEKAKEHLDKMVQIYAISMRRSGGVGLSGEGPLKRVILPLMDRYKKGERSQELYDYIMKIVSNEYYIPI